MAAYWVSGNHQAISQWIMAVKMKHSAFEVVVIHGKLYQWILDHLRNHPNHEWWTKKHTLARITQQAWIDDTLKSTYAS